MRSAWSFHTAEQLITLASIIDTMAERAIASIEQLKRDIGGNEEQLSTFAEKAFAIQRLRWVNPWEASLADLHGILKSAFLEPSSIHSRDGDRVAGSVQWRHKEQRDDSIDA